MNRTTRFEPHRLDGGDEPISNRSENRTFSDVLESRFGRRAFLKGGMSAAVATLFGGALSVACRRRPPEHAAGAARASERLGFAAVPISEADRIVVPPGYRYQVLGRWGEALVESAPAFAPSNSGRDQGIQIGSHHDGMHFFPIEGDEPYAGSSEDGLLVVNHEYVEPRFMHPSAEGRPLDREDTPLGPDGSRDADEVLKEMNAHGVSIYRIRRRGDGTWAIEFDPRNRRITARTPMEIRGPVRGSNWVVTRYSPEGHATRGTLNNCAHGVTPWNTYLAAEENWAAYFGNDDTEMPGEHARYGVRRGHQARYQWARADSASDEYKRFDATRRESDATQDYRNEPNCFGWMVEIDPFDPESTPQKRTAMGRFAHEGVVFQPAVEGAPVVCYSGDDAQFEYIYKYVSKIAYAKATAGGHLLDDGTLYVARFNDDGTGDWLPLVYGERGLTPDSGFTSQADVLVSTRKAADLVGATKMDRPEWGAVDRTTGEVYFTLTNNLSREADQTDLANPRGPNLHGHIIRWSELSDDAAGLRFEWDLFALGGDPSGTQALTGGRDARGAALTQDNMFSSPDGLWIDPDRRVWIQMDMGENVMNTHPAYVGFGNNSMLAADPDSGEIRRFLTGPIGQEITGVITTPDQRTMFINVQHPGATTTAEDFAAGARNSGWPDQDGGIPRSATVVIWREDGGVIGS